MNEIQIRVIDNELRKDLGDKDELIKTFLDNQLYTDIQNLIDKYNYEDCITVSAVIDNVYKLQVNEELYTVDDEIVYEPLAKHMNEDIRYHCNRMLFLNIFIVIDECLSAIINSLCKYNHSYISMDKLKITNKQKSNWNSYSAYEQRYMYIDSLNATQKINRIKCILSDEFQYNLADEFCTEIEILRIQRNMLVHYSGKLSKRGKEQLISINEAFKELEINEGINYNIDKIEVLIELMVYFLDDLEIAITSKIENEIFGKRILSDKIYALEKFINSNRFFSYKFFYKELFYKELFE